MKDLMGKTARIQVQSGPVLEVTNPKYSDEGAMLFIAHSEDGDPEWTPCNMVEVLEVKGKDGVWPSEAPKEEAAPKEESTLVKALREQLEEQAGAMASQAKDLAELKAMVAQLAKPAEPPKGASALPPGTPNAQATAKGN